MSITFTGGTGLFDKLGKIFQVLYYQHRTVETELGLIYDDLRATYSSDEAGIIAGVPALLTNQKNNTIQTVSATLQQLALDTIKAVVTEDLAVANPDDPTVNLKEIFSQMVTAGATVKRVTCSASSSAGGSNYGNGTVLLSVVRPDGTPKELCFAETAQLTCTADSQTGGVAVGLETFQFVGDSAESSRFASTWPAGSGQQQTLTTVDSLTQSSTGNLLSNSSWETYSVTGWDGWTLDVGAFPAKINSSTGQFYRGLASASFIGDGSTLHAIHQTFGAATNVLGTTQQLKPLTAYGVIIRHKFDVVPAAGVLRVDLTDGSNAVTSDAAGTNNRLSVTLSGLSTSWTTSTVVFRTPRVLPSELRLRIYCSTAISNGSTLFFDDVALASMTQFYEGGPLCVIFAGSTKFIQDDVFTITVANNLGGENAGSGNFQSAFDMFFDLKSKKLQVPSSVSPSIANTIITTLPT